MKLDFFNNSCKENSRNNLEFGLCDDNNNTKAYSDVNQSEKWIAKVLNPLSKDVTFTPIDHCIVILKPNNLDKESTCDGMLNYENKLYLIELKNQLKGAIPDSIDQLENTIQLINNHHSLEQFKIKKAFVCNKKHPYFHKSNRDLNQFFFKKYGFRIDINTEIQIM